MNAELLEAMAHRLREQAAELLRGIGVEATEATIVAHPGQRAQFRAMLANARLHTAQDTYNHEAMSRLIALCDEATDAERRAEEAVRADAQARLQVRARGVSYTEPAHLVEIGKLLGADMEQIRK